MSKILIVIGLSLLFAIGFLMLIVLAVCVAVLIYRDWRERHDAKPPTKDEWRMK